MLATFLAVLTVACLDLADHPEPVDPDGLSAAIERCEGPATDADLLAWSLALDEAYHDADRMADAARAARLMAARFDERGATEGRARARELLAYALFWMNDYQGAEAAALEGLKIARDGGLANAETGILLRSVHMRVLRRTDRVEEALAAANWITDALAAAEVEPESAASLYAAISRVHRFAEDQRRARLPDGAPDEPDYARAYEAARLANAATAACCSDEPGSVAVMASVEANVLSAWGKHEAAATRFGEAVAAMARSSNPDSRDMVFLESFRANALSASGQTEQALIVARSAADRARRLYVSRLIGSDGTSADDRSFVRYAVDRYLNALWTARGEDAAPSELEDAFAAAQTGALTSASLAWIQQAPRGDEGLARLARRRRDTARALDLLDARLALRTAASRGDLKTREALVTDLAEVEAQLRKSGAATIDAVAPVSSRVAAERLAPDAVEVLLFMHFSDVTAFVVTEEGLSWRRLPFEKREVCEAVSALRSGLTRVHALVCDANGSVVEADASPLLPYDRSLAFSLYGRLLAPLDERVTKASNLTIRAVGPLAALPMSALVTSPPPGEDTDPAAWRETAWLGAAMPLRTAPMLTAREPADRSRVPIERLLVLEGEPKDDRLPFARREASSLARTLGTPAEPLPVLRGREALAELSANLPRGRQPSVLAVPAHAVGPGEWSGSMPALVVAAAEDGHLDAHEIASLDMSSVDWVLLTGCNTGGPSDRPRAEPLTGLTAAFLEAGAQSVLVSHYETDDRSTAAFMTLVAQAFSVELDKAAALRAAVASASTSSDPLTAHPATWAALFLVGEN